MPQPQSALPQSSEYPPAFAGYIARVPETDIVAALAAQPDVVHKVFGAVPESRAGYRYAPGKWSIRQMAGHLADAERIMSYRALRFARGDETPLPGFEEDDYVRNAPFETCRLEDLVGEWQHLRQANVTLFRNLDAAAWTRNGLANDALVSVRAMAYILVGHVRHHLETLSTRYS